MITVPTLLLDEEKCKRNIKRMVSVARDNDVAFRPHFKTHVSREIAGWFREEGVNKITVSSLRMADYFAGSGWKDILVAFPVNILEMDLIRRLSDKTDLSLLVESSETVQFLSENLKSRVRIYIKTDIGYKRTGIRYDDNLTNEKLIEQITSSDKLAFTGFLTHAGHSYGSKSFEEVTGVHNESISRMVQLKEHFIGRYPGIIISVGDTPSCSIVSDFSAVDEIRPGNFVFYDYMQILIGSCLPNQVAVAMACPVVATHPERNEVVIYGGSIHFAKDSVLNNEGEEVHGIVVTDNGNGWEHIINGAYLTKLSQEHGIVRLPGKMAHCFKPGDIIKIIPAHSCTTANLMREYFTLDGRIITRM